MLKLNILESLKPREALCPTCAYAVIQSGFAGEELTCCALGGTVRELPFAVRECTAYIDRRIEKPDRVAGFVKPARRQRQGSTVIRIA